MQYLKLQQAFRRTDVWAGADALARGCWVSAAGYCADEENGGRIHGAKKWTDRMWIQRTGCSLEEVQHMVRNELAAWDGDDLAIHGYDEVGEKHYKARRELASEAGRASGASRLARSMKRTVERIDEAHGEANASTAAEADAKPQAEPISISIPTTSSKSSPSPGVSPRAKPTTAATAALSRRIDSVDRDRVQAAIAAGDVIDLAAAFGGKIGDDQRKRDWLRETDGLQIGTVALVLAWRRSEQAPVREASGFRAAKTEWLAIDRPIRRELTTMLLRQYGIDFSFATAPRSEAS